MGFDIAKNGLEETCFIIAVVGVTLAIAATVLRFIAIHKARRKPSWEDWCSVLATVFFILYVIPLLYRKFLLCNVSVLVLDTDLLCA